MLTAQCPCKLGAKAPIKPSVKSLLWMHLKLVVSVPFCLALGSFAWQCYWCWQRCLVPVHQCHFSLFYYRTELQLGCYSQTHILQEEVIAWLRQCDRVVMLVMEPFFICCNMWMRDYHHLQHLSCFANVWVEWSSCITSCSLSHETWVPQTEGYKWHKESQLDLWVRAGFGL